MKTPVHSTIEPRQLSEIRKDRPDAKRQMINEGANDMTQQIIERYARQNKHIRWLSEWTKNNRQP